MCLVEVLSIVKRLNLKFADCIVLWADEIEQPKESLGPALSPDACRIRGAVRASCLSRRVVAGRNPMSLSLSRRCNPEYTMGRACLALPNCIVAGGGADGLRPTVALLRCRILRTSSSQGTTPAQPCQPRLWRREACQSFCLKPASALEREPSLTLSEIVLTGSRIRRTIRSRFWREKAVGQNREDATLTSLLTMLALIRGLILDEPQGS